MKALRLRLRPNRIGRILLRHVFSGSPEGGVPRPLGRAAHFDRARIDRLRDRCRI
jgi:hypothetical protein